MSLTLHEVAQELRCSVDVVRDRIQKRQLAVIKLSAKRYRVERADLDAFKASLRQSATAQAPVPAPTPA